MAILTVQRPAIGGTTITYASAAGGGDSFPNSGSETFRVRNDDASPVTLTFDSPNACSFGVTNAAHDLAVVVAAGAEMTIGTFSVNRFNDTNGRVQVTYSGVTSLFVAVEAR